METQPSMYGLQLGKMPCATEIWNAATAAMAGSNPAISGSSQSGTVAEAGGMAACYPQPSSGLNLNGQSQRKGAKNAKEVRESIDIQRWNATPIAAAVFSRTSFLALLCVLCAFALGGENQ